MRHWRWAAWIGAVIVATVAMLLVRASLDKAHVTLVYLVLVLGASAFGGRALGLTVAGLGFLAFDWFFLPPYGTLTITNPLDWLVLVAFLLTSAVATQLLYRANATAEAATQRAIEVDRLATLGAEALNAVDADEALRAIAEVIRVSVNADACGIYVIGVGSDRQRRSMAPGDLVDWIIEHGTAAVELVDRTIRMASGGLAAALAPDEPASRALAMPLQVRGQTVGVLRIAATNILSLSSAQLRLLTAMAYYAALGAERARLVAKAERAEAERRVERLRSALLTAVSHDLRTPLTTIKGIAAEIQGGADRERAAVIESEADRLDALVGDLLDLSRIHAGAVRPTLAVNTIDDLLGAALRRAEGALRQHRVRIDDPGDELLAGVFDFTQTLRILVNLLDNAAKYSPAGSTIDVRVRTLGDRLAIDVLDRGPGVPEVERERIFESFYRPPGPPPDIGGHGLGLSIARGLAEAQGGSVRYAPRPGGGSVFTLELRAAEPLVLESEIDGNVEIDGPLPTPARTNPPSP